MVTQQTRQETTRDWVLLSYRMPREPSTPRIAVWRKLKDLGVAQVGDGLVALPQNARTKEQLEWVAARVEAADGDAIVWTATPSGRRHGRALRDEMTSARSAEYRELIEEVAAESRVAASGRTIARWRRQWRRIEKRDYFGAPERDDSRLVIADAAATVSNQMTSDETPILEEAAK